MLDDVMIDWELCGFTFRRDESFDRC